MPDALLTLNAGSSSVKFSVFEGLSEPSPRLSLRGQIDKIDSRPRFAAEDAAGAVLADESWSDSGLDYDRLLSKAVDWAESHLGGDKLVAVGHRVVHGGAKRDRAALVTDQLIDELAALAPLAPLHQPHNLAPMRAIARSHPRLPQAACFDTAFHHSMPTVAARFALPRELEAAGVRRYGFHGLSYDYISRRLREGAPRLAAGRVVAAHLGNGASLCALSDGRSLDTTMTFTALDGLPMGTRCGALDPGVIFFLAEERGLTIKEIEELLYEKSGLLGVSGGLSSDMRTLLASADPRAADAIDLFAFRIARETGALASSLGGLDGFVFTAGIGENAAPIRAQVCERLAWLGAELDEAANEKNASVISLPSSRVEIRVIPTSEETTIARQTIEIVGKRSGFQDA
jgi:acetate kinase